MAVVAQVVMGLLCKLLTPWTVASRNHCLGSDENMILSCSAEHERTDRDAWTTDAGSEQHAGTRCG